MQAFDIETYKDALIQESIYFKLPTLISQFLAEMANDPKSLLVAKGIDAYSLEKLLVSILPTDAIKIATNDLLMQLFEYVDYKRTSVEISLEPIHMAMNSPDGIEEFKQLLSTYPKCTSDQLDLLFDTGFVSKENEIILCDPPGQYVSRKGLIVFSTFIPAQIKKKK